MVLYGCFGPFQPPCMMKVFSILRYLTFSSLLCERVGEVRFLLLGESLQTKRRVVRSWIICHIICRL
jgi:hypothetical protein